jgi:hypothetical protein
MKKYVGSIQSLLIIILAAVLLYQSQCSRKPDVEPEVIVTIETKWDTEKLEEGSRNRRRTETWGKGQGK